MKTVQLSKWAWLSKDLDSWTVFAPTSICRRGNQREFFEILKCRAVTRGISSSVRPVAGDEFFEILYRVATYTDAQPQCKKRRPVACRAASHGTEK